MKISVALCTFNGGKFLAKQLESILDQTVGIGEIVICDDGSADNTFEILEEFKNRFPSVIKLYKYTHNVGAVKNFGRAISLTTGDIIFLSDQDDIWYPDKVKKAISVFNDKPDISLLFSDGDLIDEDGVKTGFTLWEKWNFNVEMRERWRNNKLAFNDLLRNNNKVTGATVAFKKELKKKILPIRVPGNYWHDTWIALHAAAFNGIYFIEESLIQYRIHSNQQIGVPGNNRSSNNTDAFNESVSYKEFCIFIESQYPELFNKSKRSFIFTRKLYLLIKKYIRKYSFPFRTIIKT